MVFDADDRAFAFFNSSRPLQTRSSPDPLENGEVVPIELNRPGFAGGPNS
ncbi:hypothetical protein V5F59_11455 [Xanthobacter autotrophicus DSM 431]